MKFASILTTEPNELMSRIHNSKKRMPIILDKNFELDWLNQNILKSQNYKLLANIVAPI